MSDSLPSIDLDLPKKLQDRDYRRQFFLAEASALIAKQLIELRKRRDLTQTDLADLAETGQPAISRAERADYRNWSFNTLRSLAEAMDARIRVLIEPAEDVLAEYGAAETLISALPTASAATEQTKAGQTQPSLAIGATGTAAQAVLETSPRLHNMSESRGISRN